MWSDEEQWPYQSQGRASCRIHGIHVHILACNERTHSGQAALCHRHMQQSQAKLPLSTGVNVCSS